MLSFVCVGDQTPVFQKLVSLSLSMMPPSLYLSSSGTQLALPSQSRSRIQPDYTRTKTYSGFPYSQMNQISVFQRRQEWIVSPDMKSDSQLCHDQLVKIGFSFPFTFNLNKWIQQRDTCLTTNKIDIWDGVGDPPWNSQSFDRDIFMELGSNILKKLDLARVWQTIERNKNILALWVSYLRLFQSFDESSRG